MRVLDHEPRLWYLLEHDGAWFLDVSCNHGAFGYTVLIELDGAERARYARDGHQSLTWLAEAVQDSGPAPRGSWLSHQGRDVGPDYAEEVTKAVNEFWANQYIKSDP